ncbi:MAG: hypothetical protein K2Q20_08445 [Phycisphaerales bacterium]|nr:hypothetical protein [Phycisphaerales bacterium]
MLDVRDMTFVVRCAGERTMDAAIALLREQVAALGGDPRAQVRPVSERPFVNAVRATLELGIASGRPWTIGMDADVLLLSDGVRRLAGLCSAAPDDVYTITTLVYCKYFGGFCFRGIHAYPTRLLGEALPLVESSNAAESLRPETSVVNAMLARGYKMLGPPVPVGAHDFEQSFRHIYLKMRLRARRELGDEPGKTTTDYFEFVRARAAVDPEYLVASWGLEDGRRDALSSGGSPAHYDWDAKYPELDDRLTRAGMTEKGPLGLHEARGLADRLMASHEYVADRRTPKWIRDKHGFAEGVSVAGARMGLGVPLAA